MSNLLSSFTLDKNVYEVMNMLKTRSEAGFVKYKTTTERTDLSFYDWLQHLQEELLDAAIYVQRLKKEVSTPDCYPSAWRAKMNG